MKATLQRISCQRIHLHNIETPIEAAMRADAIVEKSDLDGYAIWKRIRRTVERATFTLRATFRSESPWALSRSISLIFRMDNLSAGIPPPGSVGTQEAELTT